MVKKICDAEFEQVKNDSVAVIDFSAQWCGPCKMLAPIVDELSEEFNGKAAFYTADVDECPELSRQFGIVSIPFVAVLKNGSMAGYNIGFVPKDALKKFICDKAGLDA